ncbi:hypothetical protein JTB14_025174 [Gonioctena quinquepunctata]|nr:hypothetical protein JTB14_025174 [Gonioctena quinquepunctata]
MKLFCSNLEATKRLSNPQKSSRKERKRFNYLIKQGLPAEEAKVKSIEPMKKESEDMKGSCLRRKLPTVNRRKNREMQKEAAVPQCLPNQP